MDWKHQLEWGKYEGKLLLNAWIQDKQYFVWLMKEGSDMPEIEFIKSQLTTSEIRSLGLQRVVNKDER